jgi:Flp pilus assembly protein TadG
MMKSNRKRNVATDRRGSVSVEMAMVLPVLLTLLGGAAETVNYVLIHQKVERTSATLSDLTSQSTRMTEAQMQRLFLAVDRVMQPYELAADGNIVVTSISARGGNAPTIDWQRSTGGGHNVSEIGSEGETAELPAGLTLRDGENVITCEAWFDYRPVLFTGIIGESTLYRSAVFRPRFGKLDIIYP